MVKALEDIIAKAAASLFRRRGRFYGKRHPGFPQRDGLYHQKYDYPPETILSHTFWEENPEEFTVFTATS